jgi:molybdopterin converting factor small subunit
VIRVEFYDVARVRAGTAAIEVDGATLRDVLSAAAARCPGLRDDVIADGVLTRHWRASRNGSTFLSDPDTRLTAGDAVLVLSALAGG